MKGTMIIYLFRTNSWISRLLRWASGVRYTSAEFVVKTMETGGVSLPPQEPVTPVNLIARLRAAQPLVGCSHDWREPVDSQFSNETYTEVKCTKCGMVGEKTIATGEVFFPAT